MKSFLEWVDVELLLILLSPLIASFGCIVLVWPRCGVVLRRAYSLTRDGDVRCVGPRGALND